MAMNQDKHQKTVGMKDGRVRRGTRNHEAIMQALSDLIKETHLPPSIADIAQRAGVGTRTIFRQFEDVETLYQKISERVLRDVTSMPFPTAPSGDLEHDLRMLVARRARIFEHITPFRHAGQLVKHQSAFLQKQNETLTQIFRTALMAVVSPHIGDAACNIIEALDTLLSFEAWDRLRCQQKLNSEQAEHVLADAALVLAKAAVGVTG